MPSKVTPPMVRTPTPGVYKRGNSYTAKWHEDGKAKVRTFKTYDAAVAFRRDFVIPYRKMGATPPTHLAPGKGDGWIYVFQARDGERPVKVGFSKDPGRRMADLCRASGLRLDLVLLLPATVNVEKVVHERLSEYRRHGEWFSREAVDVLAVDFVKAIRST